ncbi:hypothetical protein GGR57DRAFT_508163 [Xylariaceae sp. FL1272]|nr:hypothetical protein GGR57DRAFT_508163 [Xylariaceae sp. FL1272]
MGREAALRLWRARHDEDVWLRTQYEDETDERFAEMRAICESNDSAIEEDCRTWTVLDDRSLPNLTVPPPFRRPRAPQGATRYAARIRRLGHSALRRSGQGNKSEQLEMDDVEAGPAGMSLQASVVASFLFVADAEAFETGRLRLFFIDGRGNVVRESRVPSQILGRYATAGTREPGSVLGEKYMYTGELGRELFGLDSGVDV